MQWHSNDVEERLMPMRFMGALLAVILWSGVSSAQPALAPWPLPGTIPMPVAPVKLQCNVEGARLFVDGEFVGSFPLAGPLELTASTHLVAVSADGYLSTMREVTVADAHWKPFKVVLLPWKDLSDPHHMCEGDDCSAYYPVPPFCMVESGQTLSCVECLNDDYCGARELCEANVCKKGPVESIPSASAVWVEKRARASAVLFAIGAVLDLVTVIPMAFYSLDNDAIDEAGLAYPLIGATALAVHFTSTILAVQADSALRGELGLPVERQLHGLSWFFAVAGSVFMAVSMIPLEDDYQVGLTPSFGATGVLLLLGGVTVGSTLTKLTRHLLGETGVDLLPWVSTTSAGGMAAGVAGRF